MGSYLEPKHTKRYSSIKEMICDLSEILVPPERISVSEAAALYRRVYNPPAYTGPWSNEKVPYMKEPMDLLESRDHSAVCLVSAAQSAKTEAMLNWACYNIKCDPSDFMIVEKSKTEAKNFSMMKLDRMIRHSPEISSRLIKKRNADNVHDKKFKSGTFVTITWPTVNSLSGKTIRRVGLTDYDRMPQDVGGEGSPFDLARRRTNSFKRLGMTYVESSPSFDVLDPRWKPKEGFGDHSAPPCEGVLGIYNRGDRRRRYWQCPHCKNWFEPSFSTLRWPNSSDVMEQAETAFMACPHCFDLDGAIITQAMRPELDYSGLWLPEGMSVDTEGKTWGKPRRSDIASFWLKGPNTAFGQWKNLVLNYLLALQEYESTGNDKPLKTTVNTDQGEAYIPPHLSEARTPEDIMNRATDIGDRVVPEDVRCLIASIDVQKNMFVVQVHGVIPAPNRDFDLVVIDRYVVKKSARLDEDGERYWVNPGAHPEDWDLLTDQVVKKTYPLCGYETGHMAIRLVLCDSGGRAGVTTNSYKYYRRLRAEGYGGRFLLVKGASSQDAPTIRKTFPDSDRKDRKAGARGEIPVLMLNTNLLKDWLDKCLGRLTPGGGYIVFPDWLEIDFYKELCAEVKTTKGWENPKKLRNEATDLLDYCYAGCMYLRLHKLDWEEGEVPNWASEWEHNPLVSFDEDVNPVETEQRESKSRNKRLRELAEKLA